MGSVYSAGSASVQIVPDFSNAQRRIGEWFAKQGDMKVKVQPDLDNLEMARIRAQVAAQRPEMKVGIDKKHLAREMVTAVDFLTGTSMVGKALAKLFDVKPILMTNLAGAGVALGATLGQALTNGIGGAAAMLPALTAGLAIPIGTAVLGSQGIVDAFKGLGGSTPADAKKLAAAMKDLAPAARDFVVQVHSLAPAFKNLRLDVQQHLFAGLGDSIRTLGEKMLPMLRGHLTGIADEIGGMGKALAGALGSSSNVADFAHTIDNVKAALHGITGAVAPLWSVFQNLATVGSDFLPGLSKGFGDLAQRFATFIQTARDSGALKEFIATAFDGLKQIWGVVKNLGGVLGSIFTTALPSGQVLMKILGIIAGDLNSLFKTDAARSGLRTFFEGLTTAIGNLTPGLESLVGALVTSVLPAMAGLAEAIAPIVNSVGVQFADLLRTLGPLLYPALADAISTALGALAPLIDVFAHLATTVLPVVIKAIQTLAPLFAELAEGVGDGLVRAIDALAPALPPILEAFQAIAEVLVPFAVTVVNLAVDILPPFVAILEGLAKALQFIAPILPGIVTAFVAWKAAAGLAALFTGMSTSLLGAALAAERLGAARLSNTLLSAAGGAERAGGALKGFSGPLAVVTLALAAGTIQYQAQQAKVEEWSKAILAGGKAAQEAAKAAKEAEGGFNDFVDSMQFGKQTSPFEAMFGSDDEERFKEATKRSHELFAAMDPLEQATSKVTYWQNELNLRMGEYGEHSPQVEAAQRRFHFWSGEVTRQQGLQAEATKTATERIQEQADLERASVDAQLAYERALIGVHRATDDYNTALAEYNAVMNDANATDKQRLDAQDAFNEKSIAVRESILSVADAAAKKAEQDYKGTDATEKSRLSAAAYLQALKDQAAQLTGPAREAMDAYIAQYEATNGAASQARAAVEDLGLKVENMPDGHTIVVDVPTQDQLKRLQALGYTITYLPDGTVSIDVDTDAARKGLQGFLDSVPKEVRITARVVGNSLVSVGGKGGLYAGSIAGAIGGIVRAYASGGIEPMRGGIAQVVKPNTWRIIGDRVRDDEAYIPINRDARSQAILSTTAEQMGFGLVANATGNLFTPPGLSSVYSGPGREAMAAAERDARMRQAAALAGNATATTSVAGFVNHGTVVTTDLDELARKSRRGTQRALVAAGL